MAYQNSINIGIQLQPETQVKQQLQSMLDNISKNTKINLNFDFSNANKSFTDFSNVLKNIEQQIKNFNTQLNNTGNNNPLNNTNQSATKLEATIERMNTKLKTSTSNAFINPSVLSDLQNRLNSINTNTPERKIKELQSTINNLGSSDSQIVRLQNSITKMTTNLLNLKSKFGSGLIDSKATSQVQAYEQQLEKLKTMLNQLKSSGSSIGGATITNELNNMTNASRNLNTTLKDVSSSSSSLFTRLQSGLGTMGIYVSSALAIRKALDEVKQGFEQVISVENSLVNLRRIYQMTDEEAKNLTQTISNQALVMGTNTQTLLDLTTQWKKLGYSIEDSQKLAQDTQMFDYSADLKNTEESAKSLVSVMKGFGLNANDALNIADKIDAVGNNFAVSAGDMNESLRVSSSALGAFGNNLDQSLAMATRMNEVLQNASTTGQSLKSIASRLTSNDSAIKAIEKVGINLDNENGKLKSTYDLVKELGKAYETMPDNSERADWLANIFGIRQVSAGVTLLNTYKDLDSVITSIGENQGIVQQEFDIRMNSTSAKIEQLKQTINQMWEKTISSDFTKSFIVGITDIVKVFGNLPTVIGLATTALMIFKGQAILGAISSMGIFISDLIAITAGESAMTVATVGATSAFEALDIAMASNPLGAIALIFTGVAIAINKAKNAQDDLIKSNKEVIDSYNSEKESLSQANKLYEEKQNLENKIENTNEGTKENKDLKEKLLEVERNLATALPNSASGYDSQNKAISSNNKLIQAQIDLKNKQLEQDSLKQLKDNGTMFDADIKSFKNMQSTLEEYKKLRDLALEKNSNASNSGNKLIQFTTQQAIDDYNKEISAMETQVAQRRLLILQLAQTGKSYKQIANDIGTTEDVVKSYTDIIDDNTSITNENTNAKEKNKNVRTDSQEEASAEQEKANAIAEATSEYSKSTQTIAQMQGYIDRLNKAQAMTPTLAKQIAKAYPEIGDSINSVASAQDFLNGKIQEQVISQQQAYEIMKGDDEQFYQDKIANNSQYQNSYNDLLNAFTTDGEQAYSVDFGNYKTLNELKNGTQNDLGVAIENWLSQFVGSSATGYANDFSNFKSFAEAKADILAKLQSQIQLVTQQMNNSIASAKNYADQIANGMTRESGMSDDGSSFALTENEAKRRFTANTDYVDNLSNSLGNLNTAYQKVDTSFGEFSGQMGGFSGGNIGGGSDFSGTGGGSGSKGGSGKDTSASDAKKAKDELIKNEKEMLSKITDAYDDAKNKIDSDVSDIEYNEKLLGKADNTNFVQRVDLANQKIAEQKELVNKATNQLMDLSTVTVTTDEAQKSLADATQKASKELQTQKLAVLDLQDALITLETEQISKVIDKEKELAQITLDTKQAIDKQNLETDTTDAESIHQTIMDGYEEQLQAIEDQRTAEENDNKEAELKTAIITQQNDLLEKQNDLKQKEIDLERVKNQKTVYQYQKQDDGSYQFKWVSNQKAVKSATDAVTEARKSVTDSQQSLKEAKKSLTDYYADLAYEESKKEIEAQKTAEDEKYKLIQDGLDKRSKVLEEQQTKEKKQLDLYYSDTEKLVSSYLAKLNQQYGDDWKTISDTISKNLDDITNKYNNVMYTDAYGTTSELNASLGLQDAKASNTTATDTETISETFDDVESVTSSKSNKSSNSNVAKTQIKAQTELLEKLLQNLKDYNAKMLAEKTDCSTKLETIETDANTKSIELQKTTEDTQLGNDIIFLQTQNELTEAMLNTLHLIYDESWGDIVNITTLSTDEIVKQLQIQIEAMNKYMEAYNNMHENDKNFNKLSTVSMSSVLSDYSNYKNNSLSDYISAKELLYGVGSNSLSASGKLDTSGLTSIANANGNNLNALTTTTNNKTSSVTTNEYHISGVNVQSDNISEFLDSVTTIANQKVKTK